MKKIITIAFAGILCLNANAQEKENDQTQDTTRLTFGKKEVVIYSKDSIDIDIEDKERKSEAHWAGLELGFNILTNASNGSNFPNHPFWENDVAKSLTWNWNIAEHKFNIAKEYFGVTTGLGFSFQQYAIKNNFRLYDNVDSVYAIQDTVTKFTKNKLKVAYLTVPLLLEFNTNIDSDKSFYFATGIIGGVRIGSKTKIEGEENGKEFQRKVKSTYGLNAFRADATVRLGYGDWGFFANYPLVSLFEKDKTVEVNPITFGLTLNF